eukprot:3881954-Rhodomonas_salina.1
MASYYSVLTDMLQGYYTMMLCCSMIPGHAATRTSYGKLLRYACLGAYPRIIVWQGYAARVGCYAYQEARD